MGDRRGVTVLWWEDLSERDCFEKPSLNWRIILK
jgi:hypothetical protein